MAIWESCWSCRQTRYFHLFVCLAIVMAYGQDVTDQALAHDEILLYFSSLAMHMDGATILRKARGLLCQFLNRAKIPCTLADVCTLSDDVHETSNGSAWEGLKSPVIECVQIHPEGDCCATKD